MKQPGAITVSILFFLLIAFLPVGETLAETSESQKPNIVFIKTNSDNPFFLFISYTIPHYSDYPKDSPDHYMVSSDEPYSEKDWPQMAKNYAAMISRMDTECSGREPKL